jgi:hypothetical protein
VYVIFPKPYGRQELLTDAKKKLLFLWVMAQEIQTLVPREFRPYFGLTFRTSMHDMLKSWLVTLLVLSTPFREWGENEHVAAMLL